MKFGCYALRLAGATATNHFNKARIIGITFYDVTISRSDPVSLVLTETQIHTRSPLSVRSYSPAC